MIGDEHLPNVEVGDHIAYHDAATGDLRQTVVTSIVPPGIQCEGYICTPVGHWNIDGSNAASFVTPYKHGFAARWDDDWHLTAEMKAKMLADIIANLTASGMHIDSPRVIQMFRISGDVRRHSRVSEL